MKPSAIIGPVLGLCLLAGTAATATAAPMRLAPMAEGAAPVELVRGGPGYHRGGRVGRPRAWRRGFHDRGRHRGWSIGRDNPHRRGY